MLDLIYEIFDPLPRQGPGSIDSTKRAIEAISCLSDGAKILDVGCGSGMQTIALAGFTQGEITAIDNHQHFLDRLREKVITEGLLERIRVVNCDMNSMCFKEGIFDLIWSEGAIYIMGFEKGLDVLKRFLVPKGYMAITEMSWIKKSPPSEVREFFDKEYPVMKDIEGNLNIIKSKGYHIIEIFTIPESAWWDDFYDPLEVRVKSLKEKYAGNEEAQELLKLVDMEVSIYRKYSDYYGYVFYIMQSNE